MKYDFNREWLKHKFEEIRRRTLKAIEQLDNEQLNWSPNDSSHSIADLFKHIEGNIQVRIVKGMLLQEQIRNPGVEPETNYRTREELERIIRDGMQLIIETIDRLSDEELEQKQTVRSRERTHLDMLHQCAAHYSEHMGQIFYIAKQCLGEAYKTTSI